MVKVDSKSALIDVEQGIAGAAPRPASAAGQAKPEAIGAAPKAGGPIRRSQGSKLADVVRTEPPAPLSMQQTQRMLRSAEPAAGETLVRAIPRPRPEHYARQTARAMLCGLGPETLKGDAVPRGAAFGLNAYSSAFRTHFSDLGAAEALGVCAGTGQILTGCTPHFARMIAAGFAGAPKLSAADERAWESARHALQAEPSSSRTSDPSDDLFRKALEYGSRRDAQRAEIRRGAGYRSPGSYIAAARDARAAGALGRPIISPAPVRTTTEVRDQYSVAELDALRRDPAHNALFTPEERTMADVLDRLHGKPTVRTHLATIDAIVHRHSAPTDRSAEINIAAARARAGI